MPMHMREPLEKGKNLFSISLGSLAGSASQRSGRNDSGSLNVSGSRW